MINPAIFRAYDIRGSSLSDINPATAYKIGFCFGKMNINNNNNLICVGRDGRLSSDALYQGLTNGLHDAGANLLSVGVVPTPVLYFADQKFNPAGSIMITGSHNPKDDNGFKMLARGKTFFGDQIKSLYHLLQSTKWDNNLYPNDFCDLKSYIPDHNQTIVNEYTDRILYGLVVDSNLKIAWDPGNGAACLITQLLKNRLPNKNIVINDVIDGNFPNHHPDPTVDKNLIQLLKVVKSESCDFGIAFDGDADRIGVIDNTGAILCGDQILCLFAKDILINNPGANIIADVKTSQVVFDQIQAFGGNPIMWKTGHSFIKTKMHDTGALLAGEMSGHIFFADKYYGYDDAIYAAIRLIDLCSRYKKPLNTLLTDIPKVYNTPEIRIKIDETQKLKVIEHIKNKLTAQGLVFNDIDGVRVNVDNGWWLLRSSNTEAMLIIRCESSSKEGLQKLVNYVSALLLEIGVYVTPVESYKNN